MRYHDITKDDMLNGEGLRVVLWVSGCSHNCKGCHNPVTWDARGGLPFDGAARQELFEELEKPHISGVTLSGGDPLYPDNREEIGELVEEIGARFPYKTIWLYTGYEWESIQGLPWMHRVDVVVDGEFVEGLKDNLLHWKGSKNQRVIDVRRSLLTGQAVLYEEP